MTEFRNAYHFVPRKPPRAKPEIEGDPNSVDLKPLPDTQREFGLTKNSAMDGHAIYHSDGFSGRITCRITLECPTVIGAERVPPATTGSYSVVKPFMFRDQPAIPATSLKGMISAVFEAATNSAYRVLDNGNLTVRKSGKKQPRRTTGVGASRMGQVHDYFNENLRPMNGNRLVTTMAERVFGFVRSENDAEHPIVATAGKVRFSHGRLTSHQAANPDCWFHASGADFAYQGSKYVRLKEQSTPMKSGGGGNISATPNFYYKQVSDENAFIDKETFAMSDPLQYEPQGQKAYLHSDNTAGEPWRTKAASSNDPAALRKAAVRPLAKDLVFEFHVDFDNLQQNELAALLFAISPVFVDPSSQDAKKARRYRHKIGLGKGLGLGSVRIDITSLTNIKREERYSKNDVFKDDPRKPGDPVYGNGNAYIAGLAWHASLKIMKEHDEDAWTALRLIGTTHAFDDKRGASLIPVLWVPLTSASYAAFLIGRSNAEDKSFQWFSDNEGVRQEEKQKLRPIKASHSKYEPATIPTLDTDTPPLPPKRR